MICLKQMAFKIKKDFVQRSKVKDKNVIKISLWHNYWQYFQNFEQN